jgi:WD40 repeat protein
MNENQPQSWQCVHTLTGHTSWVYGVPISPDSQILASVCGTQILIWDLKTGEQINILSGHSDTIFSLVISPDGQTIASGSADKTVKLWNLQTGELIRTFSQRADPIYSVAFSPNGKVLASGGSSKYKGIEGKSTTIYLWNLDTGELMRTLSGHSLRINFLTFAPDSHVLASGSNDETIKIWNLETGELRNTLIGHSANVRTVAITPNGKTLVSSGGGGIKIWDLATTELLHTLSEDLEYVISFTISPNGRTLAHTTHSAIEIWNLETRELICTLDFPQSITVAFSPDGKMLASGSSTCYEDGAWVKVWQVPFELTPKDPQSPSTSELTVAEKLIEAEGYFETESIEDARSRINTSIVRRQGQPQFRKSLLKAYNRRCVITGCDAEQGLEAAHIIPYLGTSTNHPSNGLLLRSDIHTLFDLHLLSINPETMTVIIAPSLINTCYGEFVGKHLQLSLSEAFEPSREAIEQHYKVFLQNSKEGN